MEIRGLRAGLGVLAVAFGLLAAGDEAAPRRAGLKISIVRIGAGTVRSEELPEIEARGLSRYYYVRQRESLTLKVSAPLPPRARLYPLVRREGGGPWIVQPEAVGPAGRNAAGEWQAEARFGFPSEAGGRFELMVVTTSGPLPPAPLPERTRAAVTLAESEGLHVERRRGRPAVGVAAVDGVPVYGDGELAARETSRIEVVARDLPAESVVGLVIHPLGTHEYWVMPELAGEGTREIAATFGAGRTGDGPWRYTVSAFVAWGKDLPPRSQPLPDRVWEGWQPRFLASSRLVRVVRWERDLYVVDVGGLPVSPGRVHVVGPQEDVHGVLARPLAADERIWLVALPAQGDPWVAGWTGRLDAAGRWAVNAAALWRPEQVERFDLVAVVSPGDAVRLGPRELRAWLYGEEKPHHSVRVWIKSGGTP